MNDSLLDDLTDGQPEPLRRRLTRRPLVLGAVAVVAVAGIAGAVALTRPGSSPVKLRAVPTTTTTAKAGARHGPLGCLAGTWPAIFDGQPTSMATATGPAFFVWNDKSGWHIRAVDKKSTDKLAIKVTAADALQAYSFKTVPAKAGKVKITGNVAQYDFSGSAAPSGIDFALCTTTQARIDLASGTLPAAPDEISVGATSQAVTNPLLVTRTP